MPRDAVDAAFMDGINGDWSLRKKLLVSGDPVHSHERQVSGFRFCASPWSISKTHSSWGVTPK